MVSRIADAKLPFGGSWTYEIRPGTSPDLATLRITENGEVYNPVFRFVSLYVLGQSATIDKYLAAVATRYSRIPVELFARELRNRAHVPPYHSYP